METSICIIIIKISLFCNSHGTSVSMQRPLLSPEFSKKMVKSFVFISIFSIPHIEYLMMKTSIYTTMIKAFDLKVLSSIYDLCAIQMNIWLFICDGSNHVNILFRKINL